LAGVLKGTKFCSCEREEGIRVLSRSHIGEQKRIPRQVPVRKLWARNIGSQKRFYVILLKLCFSILNMEIGRLPTIL